MGKVKELESFRWNRKISRIYDKGSVGETVSEPGAKSFGGRKIMY